MKFLKYILPAIFTLIFISCSDDENDIPPINEIQDLIKVQEISNDKHIFEVYSKSGKLVQGYNEITIRIKDKITQEFIKNALITWNPLMHMATKTHSCPKSELLKVADKQTVYNGFIVFQMAENDMEKWDLTFNYTVNGTTYEAVDFIGVPTSNKKTVSVFTGTDGVKYVLALIEPQNPAVKINDMVVGLYKMENMMSWPVVENYKINLDPRMPSMGNHSSPNNQDLIYDTISRMYKGKLSLTMTGYWKLNLMLRNQNNEILKGEAVTDLNEASTLFLELEF
ncbi:MAG: hypothetical protein ACYC01_06640 [Lutibacter sp.]